MNNSKILAEGRSKDTNSYFIAVLGFFIPPFIVWGVLSLLIIWAVRRSSKDSWSLTEDVLAYRSHYFLFKVEQYSIPVSDILKVTVAPPQFWELILRTRSVIVKYQQQDRLASVLLERITNAGDLERELRILRPLGT